jgi:hypothetical protein
MTVTTVGEEGFLLLFLQVMNQLAPNYFAQVGLLSGGAKK